MIKRTIGFVLFIASYPLILLGAAVFVINLLLISGNFAHKSAYDFVTAAVAVGVGFLFRSIGRHLQNVRY